MYYNSWTHVYWLKKILYILYIILNKIKIIENNDEFEIINTNMILTIDLFLPIFPFLVSW